MMRPCRIFSIPLLISFAFMAASAQQPGTIAGNAKTDTLSSPRPQEQSLADIARGLRKNKQAEVKMTPEDAKALFRSVDKILEFASNDTALPRKATVKRRLVAAEDVEKYFRQKIARQEYAQRFARSELTMKKFGLLPRDFDLKEFLVKANGQQVAGYYDEETKTISLLNWIPLDRQEPILAHELTHALQDQNYDLGKWTKAGIRETGATNKGAGLEDDEPATARQAVVEGQAMVVLYDYLLAPMGRNLKDTPGLVASIEDPSVTAVIDTPLMHAAPMVLRESGAFPYRDGLVFEAKLLEKGGKQLAFAGAFARPPRSTHEVLQPDTYLHGEKLAPLHLPDLRSLVEERYEMYDSGEFGELDVRALLKQLSDKRAAADLSPAWHGGAYIAFRRKPVTAADSPVTPAEVALIYVSRWRTPEAAQRFAQQYAQGTLKRYKSAQVHPSAACLGTQCPTEKTMLSTEEGPVIIEQWPDNTLVISESFDQDTAAKLRDAVLHSDASQNADFIRPQELSLRLQCLPAFREFQWGIAQQILAALAAHGGKQEVQDSPYNLRENILKSLPR